MSNPTADPMDIAFWIKDSAAAWDKCEERRLSEGRLKRLVRHYMHESRLQWSLDWSDPPGTHLTSWLQRTSRVAPRITKDEADKTPPAFAELLVELARSS